MAETDNEMPVTVSRVLMMGEPSKRERDLLHKWAELAASGGGRFAIKQEWTESQWYTTFTIHWPSAEARAAAEAGNTP